MNQISFCQMRWMMRTTDYLKHRISNERDGTIRISACVSRIPKDRRNHSQIEESVIEIVDMENECRELETRLKEMQDILDSLIGGLDNPNDRVLLRLRYMKCFRPEDIAGISHHTINFIYHALGRAERALIRLFPDLVRT